MSPAEDGSRTRRRRPLRALAAAKAGVAAIEFALAAPVLLTLLLGVVEGGRLFAAQTALDWAVRQSARYAVVHGASSASPATPAQIAAMAVAQAAPILTSGVTATASYAPSEAPGGTVTVSATYAWSPIAAIVPLGAIALSARTALVVQN